MTKYEKAIYDIINISNMHMTVDQIYELLKTKYPTVSLATIYNNVNKLTDAGLIRRISLEGYADRYDKIVKHDHLVCSKCGKLSDITLKDLTPSLNSQLSDDFLYYDLKVFYICPDCRKESEK